jgi:cytochrome P450
VKAGMSHPLFIFFPAFDTKYLNWFPKRKAVHDNLTIFLENLDSIIDQKKELVRGKRCKLKDEFETNDGEKDLLTLLIESEMNDGGAHMSNEELRVCYSSIGVLVYY